MFDLCFYLVTVILVFLICAFSYCAYYNYDEKNTQKDELHMTEQ